MNTIKDKSDAEEKRKALLNAGSDVQGVQEEDGAKDVEKDGDEGDPDEDVQAENVSGGDDQPVHVWIRCDGCKMDPLVGVRYKCLEWVFPPVTRAVFINDIVSLIALSALITTCAQVVRRKVSTPLNIVC